MSNVLKIIITAALIIVANVAIHFLPQWTDQFFMIWLVAVLLTVTWQRRAPDYTDAYVGAMEDKNIWRGRALQAESELVDAYEKVKEQSDTIDGLCQALNNCCLGGQ